MPMLLAMVQVITGVEVRKVGIVTESWPRFRHGVSGGEVRDEEIADGPVVSGSGSAGSGGSLGAHGAGRVLAMVGSAGVLAEFSGRDRELAEAAELVDAGGRRRGR
jgi:hypothetical protein